MLFGYLYRHLFNWKMLAQGDLISWYLTPSEALIDLSSSWMTKGLGGPRSSSPGEAIIHVIFLTIFENPSMAQRIFYLLLLPLSAVTMYLLLDYMKCSKLTKIVIPFIFAINSMTIAWWQSGIFGLPLLNIAFPITVMYLLKILENKEKIILNVLILTFILGVVSSLWQQGFILYMPIMIIFSIIFLIKNRNIQGYISRIFKSFMLFSGLFILLLAPYITTLPFMFTSESVALPARWDVEKELASVVNNYTIEYTTVMWDSFNYFMIPLAIGILFIKGSNRKYYLGSLLTGGLLLLFINLTVQGFTLDWFRQLPYLILFRSPERIGFMVMWSFILMTAFLVDELEKRIMKK